jgi:putative acetyltransferase
VIGIRHQRPQDALHVRRINELAFGQPLEADLVERLQRACPDALSLVAEDEEIAGHILFTPVVIESGDRQITGMGLAPMAVLPERQRQGIGSQLARRGSELLTSRGCPFVFVIGHPEYYPRFGFERAASHGIRCQWPDIPDDAVLVLVIDREAMNGVSGVARYRPEFDEVA